VYAAFGKGRDGLDSQLEAFGVMRFHQSGIDSQE
jgi:hypothetical protein